MARRGSAWRWPYSQAERPVSSTNTGAHRWASRRQTNRAGDTLAASIGSLTWYCRKNVSRTWSSSISSITVPRSWSMEASRREGEEATWDARPA
ncbi:hypothetical protein D3C71_1358130 [compost metagenome]